MNNSLSTEQARQYERDGIAYPVRVMSADQAQWFRAGFEEMETCLGSKVEYAAMTHLYFRWAFKLATWPKILDAVEEILGPDLLIQGSLILCKHAHDLSFVMWHQDFNYTVQNAAPTVSAWVALSNSTCRSGCLRVIPGSQREGLLPHSDTVVKDSMLTYSTEVDESSALDIELRAGEMSLHQAGIVHGSLPNQSDDKRIGFIIRFVTPRFKKTVNPVVRARGKSPCPHLTLWPGPPKGNLERSVHQWKEFVRARNLLK
jgi:non-haem Fe2+, alpha-ketoglutarate-dependent halogenase